MFGFLCSVRRGDQSDAQRAVEQAWSPSADCLACLSLRSGFDAALSAYAFPAGSEVLMSAMNIRSMAQIVESHGLRSIPIDLDIDTLAMRQDLLERAVSEKTRAVVHAHVLGARQPLTDLGRFARRHNLVLFEDCAQAYRGDHWRGDPDSDVAMFSFGPLKTCSATMGGILRFKDNQRLHAARQIQAGYPVLGRWTLLRRLTLYLALLFMTQRAPCSVLVSGARLIGMQEAINSPVRNFRGPAQLTRFRRRPSYPLLALLHRRLTCYDPQRVQRRVAAARAIVEESPTVARPGALVEDHGYWLFPVCCDDPIRVRRRLHEAGFDSTLGRASFGALPTSADRPEFEPRVTASHMQRWLYLPMFSELSEAEATRLGELLNEHVPASIGSSS